MRSLLLMVLSITTTFASAQESSLAQSMTRSIAAMKVLVAPGTETREYLYCAVISSHLELDDMYGLFIRKAGDGVADETAFAMAISYMTGFFESELLNMKGSGKADPEEVLTMVYKTVCLRHALPK